MGANSDDRLPNQKSGSMPMPSEGADKTADFARSVVCTFLALTVVFAAIGFTATTTSADDYSNQLIRAISRVIGGGAMSWSACSRRHRLPAREAEADVRLDV